MDAPSPPCAEFAAMEDVGQPGRFCKIYGNKCNDDDADCEEFPADAEKCNNAYFQAGDDLYYNCVLEGDYCQKGPEGTGKADLFEKAWLTETRP